MPEPDDETSDAKLHRRIDDASIPPISPDRSRGMAVMALMLTMLAILAVVSISVIGMERAEIDRQVAATQPASPAQAVVTPQAVASQR